MPSRAMSRAPGLSSHRRITSLSSALAAGVGPYPVGTVSADADGGIDGAWWRACRHDGAGGESTPAHDADIPAPVDSWHPRNQLRQACQAGEALQSRAARTKAATRSRCTAASSYRSPGSRV